MNFGFITNILRDIIINPLSLKPKTKTNPPFGVSLSLPSPLLRERSLPVSLVLSTQPLVSATHHKSPAIKAGLFYLKLVCFPDIRQDWSQATPLTTKTTFAHIKQIVIIPQKEGSNSTVVPLIVFVFLIYML